MKTNFNFGLYLKVLKEHMYALVGLLLLLISSSSSVNAQAKDAILNGTMLRCDTEVAMQNRFAKQPDLKRFFEDLQFKESHGTSRIPCDAGNTISIPLAFHFDSTVGCGDEACILSEVQDAINALNNDFANNTASPNAANCVAAYPAISTGTCISFYLAQPPVCSGLDIACDGAITVGQFTGGYEAGGSGAGACWDDYLNVFVVSNALGLLGVSDQIPGVLPPAGPGEGVSLAVGTFGGADGPCGVLDADNTYNLGRTLSHEIGHYLGLFHTFEGSCADEPNNFYNGIDITVNDTQPQDTPFFGCPNTCFNSDCGGPQQTANIMNYTDDACMDLFTEDQASAMNIVANGLFGALNIPAANPTALCTCEPGGGDLSITDGNARWSYTSEITGVGCGANVDFDAGNGVDQTYAADWYYAINGGSSVGFPIVDPANVTETTNTIEAVYPDLGGIAGLTATLTIIITENAVLDVQVAQLMTVENNSGSPVDIKIFNYLDLDKNGNTIQDAILNLQDECNIITQITATDDPNQVCYFAVNAADGYQIEPYSDLCDNLVAGIFDLTNTGLPLLSADYTQAYQFNGSINAGESLTGETLLTFGVPPEPAVLDPNSGQCTFPTTPNPSGGFITCPANEDITCGAEAIAGMITIDTICSVTDFIIDVTGPVVEGEPDCSGTTYTYRFIASDLCDNIDTCFQVFTIVNDGPQIDDCPIDQVVACADDIVIMDPGFSTSCSLGASVDTQGPAINGDENCPGTTYTYTYTVTDDCGRSTDCTQIFTIGVGSPPDIDDCPIDQVVACADDIVTMPPGYTTDCAVGASVDTQGPVIDGDENCPGTTYTYTYVVTDACGRSSECVQIFTIGVGSPPDITGCPADENVMCANMIVIGIPTYTTDCGVGANIINQAPVLDGVANCPGSTYTYTIRVIDECGRESTCDQVFTIVNDGPTIDCLDDMTVTCEDEIRPIMPTYTTSCGLVPSITKTGPVINGDPHCDGTTYTYTYTIVDACGRSASCEQVFIIDNTCQRLDFDAYAAGTIIDNQYPGVSISTQDNYHRPAMLFDTGNPTGNDFDLGTPNQLYGGPGIGSGYGNDAFQGNALIISKDRHVPNETEGMLIFDFDCAVLIRSIDFLDMECEHNTITLYDIDHHVIDVINIPAYGENSFHVEEINQGGVYQMVVDFPCAGGGITDIKYCEDMTPGAMCGICDDATLDFYDHGIDWANDAMSGSYTVGYQGFDIDILDPNEIFIDSHEDLSGIEIGIDPNDTEDSISIVYNLTEVASFVQFDIEDLDYKDGVSKQQESVCVCGFLDGNPTPIYPVITSLDGSVHINGNCAEATENSSVSHDDESVLVTFEECIDQVVIKYGSGPNSPSNHPTYSKMIIGKRFGFTSRTCPNACSDCPIFGDSDGDGVCDDCDVCFGGDDTIDSDGNGIPDTCDGDCASLGDADFDGVCDPNDICPGGNDNIDLDGNGIPDDCEACHEYKLVLGCTNEWHDDDISNQYDVLEQTFDINIMDMDNILEDTKQEGFGLNVGIDPHDNDDVVLIKYNLSQVANNVMFDIVDLDYKDGNSKQQEAVCIYGFLDTIPTMILPIITSLDGSVSIDGNCAEGTVNSSHSGDDESIMVVFDECIDQIVIEYGTGTNSPTHNPNYSNITIGLDLGFKTEVCVDQCLPACMQMVQLFGVAAPQHYEASERIESRQMVSESAVIYDAGDNVILKGGFQVMDGVIFSAQIGGCQN